MPVWFRRNSKFLIAVCLLVSFCFVAGEAQTRRKKRSRRAAKPAARVQDDRAPRWVAGCVLTLWPRSGVEEMRAGRGSTAGRGLLGDCDRARIVERRGHSDFDPSSAVGVDAERRA